MILKNSTYNAASLVVSVIVSLFITPFVILSLGDSDYGLWILIGSIGGYCGLLDLGISGSVTRYVSKYIALGKSDDVCSTVNTCLFLYLFIAVFVLLLAVLLGYFVHVFVTVTPDKVNIVYSVIVLIGASLAISFPFRVFNGLLQSLLRFDITSILDIVINLLRTLLVVVVLTLGYSLIALAFVMLVVSIIQLCVTAGFAFKEYPQLKLRWRFVEKRKIKLIFNYSIYKFITGVGDLLRFNIDTLVIGALISVAAITPYAIATRLIGFLARFVGQIFAVTTPMYSSYEARDEEGSIQKLFIKSSFYSALLTFFTTTMLAIYGHAFITLWVGVEYAQKGYYVLVILAISFGVALSQNPSIVVAYGVEKHRFLSILTVVEGVANLALSLMLVGRFGLVGVALGTAIPMVLFKGVVQPIYICRVVKLPVLNYMKACFLKPLLAIAVFIALHLVVRSYLIKLTLFDFILAVSLSSLVFFLIVWFVFDSEQKAYWKGKLNGLKTKKRASF